MDNKNDFTQGSIFQKMIKFMIPILGALVLQAMYGAVDVLVVGKFGTSVGISGVSTGSSVVNLIIFTIAGFSMGVTVLIGKYIGERKNENIGKVIGGGICFFTIIAIVVAIVMLTLARPLAKLMQAPKEALNQSVLYIRICGGGIFFIIAYNVISSIFRGMGNSKLPLIFVAIACVVNIVGDLIFVAVLHMDVAGAAIATVLAQAVSVVISLVIIRRQKSVLSIKKSDICFNAEIHKIVKIGSPIAFQEALTQLSFLALCAFINHLGLKESSGYGVAQKIVSFVMLVPSALMQSMASFVAQNVGAGLEKRSRQSMKTGMLIGVTVGVFIGVFSFFKGDILARPFTDDGDYILKAAEYLKGFAPEAVVTCVLFSFIGYFNGHGQTLWVMLQGIAQSFLIRLPMSYFMSVRENANLTDIGFAAPAATVFGIVINLIFYYIYTRKMKIKEE